MELEGNTNKTSTIPAKRKKPDKFFVFRLSKMTKLNCETKKVNGG